MMSLAECCVPERRGRREAFKAVYLTKQEHHAAAIKIVPAVCGGCRSFLNRYFAQDVRMLHPPPF